jgi:hypothetical protein
MMTPPLVCHALSENLRHRIAWRAGIRQTSGRRQELNFAEK